MAFALGDQARTGRDSVVRQQLNPDIIKAILKNVPAPKAHPEFASLSGQDFGPRPAGRFDVPNPVTDALVHRAKAKGLHPSDPLNYYPNKYRGDITDDQNYAIGEYLDDFNDESLPDEKRLLAGARAKVLDETPEHTEMVSWLEDELAKTTQAKQRLELTKGPLSTDLADMVSARLPTPSARAQTGAGHRR